MFHTFLPETVEFFPHPVIGEVEQTITLHQRGRVKAMGTTWFARLHDSPLTLMPGKTVKIIGREGLTLLVTSMDNLPYQTSFSKMR